MWHTSYLEYHYYSIHYNYIQKISLGILIIEKYHISIYIKLYNGKFIWSLITLVNLLGIINYSQWALTDMCCTQNENEKNEIFSQS